MKVFYVLDHGCHGNPLRSERAHERVINVHVDNQLRNFNSVRPPYLSLSRFPPARVPEVHFELSVFCFELTSLSDFETPDFGISDLKFLDSPKAPTAF
jgi:hypothetical protein